MRLTYLGLVAASLRISDALSRPIIHETKPRALDPSSVELPTCAAPCFLGAITESPCNATDIPCICLNSDSISASMTPCLLTSCRTIDVLHTQRYAAVTCGAPVRNDSRRFIVSVWAMFPFAVICVVLRFVSRTPYFGGRLGWDDWTILFLLILILVPLDVIDHYLVHYGLGQDIWMLEEYEIVTVFKLYFAGELIYLLGMTVLKISVLLQYLRIFNFRIWVYILMAISTAYGASFIIATLAGCRPLAYNFHRWKAEESGTCINITKEIYASAVINVILDGIITLLPTTQIMKLQMTQKKKLVISFIFLAGFVVTGISIARFVVFDHANEQNFTYTYIDVSILSIAELNVAIISASVPAMISLFRRLMGKRDTTKGSSGTPGTSGTPGALSSGLSSGNQSKKKAFGRDRWHGFTDVFSTRATTTLVASHPRSHADYSNDEFELLEDPVVHGGPGPQHAVNSNKNAHSHTHTPDQQETYHHEQNTDFDRNSQFSNSATSYAQNSEYDGHSHFSNHETFQAQDLHGHSHSHSWDQLAYQRHNLHQDGPDHGGYNTGRAI